MRFLSKRADSLILAQSLTYKKGQAANNEILRRALQIEQKNFCAYSERYIKHTDSPEVEHLDASKKYNDDYYNYYAVIRWANQSKNDKKYVGYSFLTSLFFHDPIQFNSRIGYSNGEYYIKNDNDQEAQDLIDFLGFNKYELFTDRENHIQRLKFILKDFTDKERLVYFSAHKEELSFMSAIEVEFGIELYSLL
jgi:hypothetical protein